MRFGVRVHGQWLFTDIRMFWDEVSGEDGVRCPPASQQFQLFLFFLGEERVDVLCLQGQMNEGPGVPPSGR